MESAQKSARLISNSSGLIEDLWPEILMRLPVKSLCRFRSVGKSWNSLIVSPFFINLRQAFTRSIASSSDKVYCNLRDDVRFPFQFRLEAVDDVDVYSISIVDVVHGLVCVSYTMDSSYDSTILWNPAIHKYLTLPRLPFPSHVDSAASESAEPGYVEECARFFCSAIGFGYDRSRDDFKVVRIWMSREYVQARCGFIPTTYDVYSTRQGLWRKAALANNLTSRTFDDVPTSTTGCFVNGAICWIVLSLDLWERSVVMFDCESQEFTMADFPQEIYEPKITWIDEQNPVRKAEVLEYDGMLSVLVDRLWEDRIELWAMKDHRSATWHKLFAFDNSCDVLNLYQPSLLKLAPLGPNQWITFRQVYAYEESMLFMDDSKVKSYTNKEIVDISIPRHSKVIL